MRELSVFVDRPGNSADDAKCYLLVLVLHEG